MNQSVVSSVGSTSKKEKPEAWNSRSLQLLMNGETKFDICMEEITFCLPMQATQVLTSAIINSHKLNKITIQENAYDEKNWQILSQGIILRKHVKLQIQFTKISPTNICYVCDTITKSSIHVLILHDCIFEGNTFDTFCTEFMKVTGIRSFEISTNNLTKDQIENLHRILEDKIPNDFKFYETKEVEAISAPQINALASDLNRFSIISPLKELTLTTSIPLTPNLCHAIKTSMSLKKITICADIWHMDYCNYQWLVDAVTASRSITEVGINAEGLPNEKFSQMMDILIDIVTNNRKITTLTVLEMLEISGENAKSIHDLLSSPSSLRNFKIIAPAIHIDTYKAIADAKYLDSLSISTTDWPSRDEHVLAIARSIAHVPKLTIKDEQMQPLVEKLNIETLTELHLKEATELHGEMIEFSKKIKHSKILTAFSLTKCFNLGLMKRFRRISAVSENLRAINFMSSPFDSTDLTKFINGLKKNTTITSASFVLNSDCANQLYDLLTENSTLLHLGVSFDDKSHQNIKFVKSALSATKTLRSLLVKTTQSLGPRILRKNTSIAKVKFSVDFPVTREEIHNFWQDIIKILQHNQVLDTVILKSKGVLGSDADAEKLLESNKQMKKQAQRNVEIFIQTMVARPETYLSILPLEVWSNIFKWIWIPGVYLDFDKILLERFKFTKY